jgi:hypothetical protein
VLFLQGSCWIKRLSQYSFLVWKMREHMASTGKLYDVCLIRSAGITNTIFEISYIVVTSVLTVCDHQSD